MEKLELRRQIFHMLFGIALVLLLQAGMISYLHLVILLLIGLAIALISLRIRIPIISWFLEIFERKGVSLPGQGALTYLIGSLIALYLLPPHVAYASILVLALGDSVGSLAGRRGRFKFPLNAARNIEGIIAGTAAAAIAASFFVPVIAAIAGAFVSMLVESIQITLAGKVVDDNIYMPILAGAVITLVSMV
jgi:dolichol kinase